MIDASPPGGVDGGRGSGQLKATVWEGVGGAGWLGAGDPASAGAAGVPPVRRLPGDAGTLAVGAGAGARDEESLVVARAGLSTTEEGGPGAGGAAAAWVSVTTRTS